MTGTQSKYLLNRTQKLESEQESMSHVSAFLILVVQILCLTKHLSPVYLVMLFKAGFGVV